MADKTISDYCKGVMNCNKRIKELETERQKWIDEALEKYNISYSEFEEHYSIEGQDYAQS